jgi:hypothetical protein
MCGGDAAFSVLIKDAWMAYASHHDSSFQCARPFDSQLYSSVCLSYMDFLLTPHLVGLPVPSSKPAVFLRVPVIHGSLLTLN